MSTNLMRLLVSVRNLSEADTAVAAGADIVDVKEPDSGSLGFAGIQTIHEVVSTVAGRVPVSAALGECTDWLRNDRACETALTDPENAFARLSFVKLGLAQLKLPAEVSVATSDLRPRQFRVDDDGDWVNRWATLRRRLTPSPTGTHPSDNDSESPKWVAVAYADHERAGAPAVWQVLDSAAASGCSTLLIDTFGKDGSGTLNWLTEAELIEVREATLRLGLVFALAGQLGGEHLPLVRRVNPDIFAVRSAVCDGSDRKSTISASRIRQLRRSMGRP